MPEKITVDHDQCSNCRFWKRDPMNWGGNSAEVGACRRRAPVSIKWPYWPETHQSTWCGEHERADEPNKEG